MEKETATTSPQGTSSNTDAPLTFGQKAVGVKFNPSGYGEVDEVKQLFADVIDKMANLREKSGSQEQKRHASIAITEAENAQMRAVKALTWQD